MFSLIFLAWVISGYRFQDCEMPPELRRMFERQARLFQTAEIDWSMDIDGRPWYFQSIYAGNDFLLVELGDEEGRQRHREPGKRYAYAPVRRLVKDGADQWEHVDGHPGAMVVEKTAPWRAPQPDIRTLGTFPHLFSYESGDLLNPETMMKGAFKEQPNRYDVRNQSDGLIEVTAFFSSGAMMLWQIDPAKDGLPVYTELNDVRDDGSHRTYRSTLRYREYGKRWFLDEVEFTDSKSPAPRMVRVQRASFDEPYHAQNLDIAESLGLIPGINVSRYAQQGESESRLFDGRTDVAKDEYDARVAAGEINPVPFWAMVHAWANDEKDQWGRVRDDGGGGLTLDALVQSQQRPRLWEEYVRTFVRVNRLSSKQSDSAWAILKKVQERAYKYLDESRDRFKALRDEKAKAQYELYQLQSQSRPIRKQVEEMEKLSSPLKNCRLAMRRRIGTGSA